MNDCSLDTIGNHNREVRGFIIRILANCQNNTAPVVQLSNVLLQRNLIISPDISKYLDYLHEKGYIRFLPDRVTAYNAYSKNATVKLTCDGSDLYDQTKDDDGVDL